ncbi:glutaredoxin family protein [Candidatus Microgenomates bacterium]|nr:glutaredoxin family protein [Candidatus Microgenomates bacterium]
MRVKIYSTVTCPYCKMLKDYLTEKKITFENVFVDQDEKGKEEMMQASGGFLGVPFTVITKGDGIKETVLGFDKNKINDVLGITG